MKEINKRIRQYRKKAGLTQNELAELISMKGSTYSQAEREGIITCELLLKVAPFLEVEPEFLLTGKTFEPPKPIIDPPPPPPPPKPTFEEVLSHKERNIIKIFRYMSQEKRNILYKFINELDAKN